MHNPFQQPVEAPMLQVHRIWTEYKQDPADPGKLIAVDMVAYGPVGAKGRTVTIDKISRLSRVQPAEAAVDNPGIAMARYTWDIISRHYEAFKAGQTAVVDGTPLAAWNALSPEQAEVLRLNGIHSVEQVANLTDSHVMRIGVPGLQQLIPQARLFCQSADTTRTAARLAEKDEQISELREQLAELAKLVQAKTAPEPFVDKEGEDDEDDEDEVKQPSRRRR